MDTIALVPRGQVRKRYQLTRLTQLEAVQSVATRRHLSPGLNGFEERRLLGFGTFIDDSTLRRSDDRRLAEVLAARLTGLRVLATRNATYAASGRDSRTGKYAILGGGKGRGDVPPACYATVYLDGTLVFDMTMSDAASPPNLNEHSVADLGGIEFYAAGASTPSQFKTGECGTLILWTREK